MESVGVTLVQIGLVALLAFVVEVLVEHLVGKPLETAAPYFPRWWLIYVSLVGGVAAVSYLPDQMHRILFENRIAT